jgi:hypothetical protein
MLDENVALQSPIDVGMFITMGRNEMKENVNDVLFLLYYSI